MNAGAGRRAFGLTVAALLIAGALLRLRYVDFGLPYLPNTDEATNLDVVRGMVARGSLNPAFFNYPSLLFMANLPGQWLVWLTEGRLAPPEVLTIGAAHTAQPAALIAARLTSLVFGLGLVALAGRWAAALGAGRAGVLLAVLLTALNPLLVRHSAWFSPEMISAFFTTAALMAATAIVTRGGAGVYALAGLLAGLAAGAKYNCGIVVVAILAAHLVREGVAVRGVRLLFLAALTSILGFALASPYFFLDLPAGLSGLVNELNHYRHGHPGASGGAAAAYARWLAAAVGVAGIGVVGLGAPGRLRPAVPALAFAVVYFLLLAAQSVRFERNLMPLLPAVLVLSAVGGEALLHRLRLRSVPALAIVGALAYAGPLIATARDAAAYVQDPGRSARDWLAARLPEGSDVIIDAYAPWLDPATRRIDAPDLLLARPIAEIRTHAYAVLATAGSGRLLHGGFPVAERRFTQLEAVACESWTWPETGAPELIVYRLDCE